MHYCGTVKPVALFLFYFIFQLLYNYCFYMFILFSFKFCEKDYFCLFIYRFIFVQKLVFFNPSELLLLDNKIQSKNTVLDL